MKLSQTHCDVCGTVKKETNHWWEVWVSGERGPLVIRRAGFIFGGIDIKDSCGESCTLKLTQRYLETGSLEG